MSLVIAHGTNQIPINHVVFDQVSNDFLCYEDENDDPIFRYTLPFAIAALPSPQFTEKIYLFKNDFVTSNVLLKLKLKEKPDQNKLVGYIFPMSALKDNPGIFPNEHLKSTAFNVILKLLKEQDLSLTANSPIYRTDAAYELTDFYDEDLVVVAVCDQFVTFPDYDFMDYLPALYRYGFRLAPNFNFSPPASDCDVVINNYLGLQAAVNISIPKNQLHLNYFINSLLKNDLFLKDNEVARFHLYYQVVEMMMERVYKNEFKNELIIKFSTLAAYDIKESARDMVKETYSLDKLVGSNYSLINNDILDELHLRIEDLLAYIRITYNSQEISRKIYKVRNVLFHGYSKVLENRHLDKNRINTYLKKVNDSFEYLLIDIVTSYRDHVVPVAP
ncbi:hypothetical protein D3C87_219390 [compost metagenome]